MSTNDICHELVDEVRRELATRNQALHLGLSMIFIANILEYRQKLQVEIGHEVSGVF